MKLNQLAFFLFVATFFSNANAQDFKLGKVSVAELQEKSHPKDPAAVAAILFKKGEVRFEYVEKEGFKVITVVQTRIKIYKKEGYDWANQAVRYYTASNGEEKIYFKDVATYNLVGDKIEKTKLKSDGEFDEQINKYWGRQKITMPNVKEGSVIEFEYTIKSPRFSELIDWSFQSSIPVNYSEFRTYIPEYFVYTPNQKGYVFPKVSFEKNNKAIVKNSKERATGLVSTTTFSQTKIDYIETVTSYLAENLPAMKEEAFVNNMDNYTSSVSHELAMTKFPDASNDLYATDWPSVTKKIYENDDFGAELNNTGYFEDDINRLLTGLKTPYEKIDAIYNFVKTNIKWNDYYGYSCNDGVKKAYKEKTGNIAEINLMLTAMLRYAGLTANPVLVSTRSNGIALFPSRTGFNYVIASVETPSGNMLLDASDKFSTPNVLPFRALNWTGRLIRKDGTSDVVDLMPKVNSNSTVMMNYTIDERGTISGKLRKQQTDYNAMTFRKNVDNVTEDSYLEKLENENRKIEVTGYSRQNEKDLKLAVMETYSFTGSNLCEVIGGKIYVSPMLFFTEVKNPFQQEVREYPVDYGFPFMEKNTINIYIPEGYAIERLPDPTFITMQENLGSFRFNTNVVGNQIQISITNQVNTAIIAPAYYSMLKEYYQGIIDKENEKIILTKV
jgi:transglutaminase-like putative cysteine protease